MNDAIITVATDGSAGSRRAFEWALEEAERQHCGIELVAAYSATDEESRERGHELALRNIHATIDDIAAGRVELPTISSKVVPGEPADVLIRESQHSRLLVMGSHGVSQLRHSALGSVTDMCARMAECPVVVIPPRGRRAAQAEEHSLSVED